MTRDALREALDLLDVIDGIVDDTHPEGDGCPLCSALDELRATLSDQDRDNWQGLTVSDLDVDRLVRALQEGTVGSLNYTVEEARELAPHIIAAYNTEPST